MMSSFLEGFSKQPFPFWQSSFSTVCKPEYQPESSGVICQSKTNRLMREGYFLLSILLPWRSTSYKSLYGIALGKLRIKDERLLVVEDNCMKAMVAYQG